MKTIRQFLRPGIWISGLLSLTAGGQDLPCHVGPKTIRAYSVATSNSICLIWPGNEYRQEIRLARREYDPRPENWQNWTEIHAITNAGAAAETSSFCDTNVSSGVYYEYRLAVLITNYPCNAKTASPYWYYQHLSTGTQVPLRDQRGNVLLLVESGIAAPLAEEIARLEADLCGDGYRVFRHDAPASEVTAPGWPTNVANTKALVKATYLTDPSADWTLFIVGHVPIPYSGLTSPGSHSENFGAHPADWYYADMDDAAWTDTTANDTSGEFPAQHNVPGDGKFDQKAVPTAPEMRVGRIDLRNMPAFGKSEVELLRQYLDRNHAWRHKHFTVRDLGLINSNNNKGLIYRGLPVDAHDRYASFFGTTNKTLLGDWLNEAASPSQSYLLASSAGNGLYTRDMQIGSTADFAATNLYAVFTTLFGSYYGDWDSTTLTNVVLLAPLASAGYTLTTYYHENIMNIDSSAMGGAIGDELFALACSFFRGPLARYDSYANVNLELGKIFIINERPKGYTSLLGDPTLRMRVVAPPTDVTVNRWGADVLLTWAAAVDAQVQGYHVYRAPVTNRNDFTRLTSIPVPAEFFCDTNAPLGDFRYMVRTVKLEQSPARSYYNASQGAFAAPGGTSRLAATISPEGERALLITGVPGQAYTLQYTTNLANGTGWGALTNITLSSPTGYASLAATNPVIFYRLKH